MTPSYNIQVGDRNRHIYEYHNLPAEEAWSVNTVWIASEYGKQGKSEGFESCDRPTVRKCPIWVKIMWPWNLMDALGKQDRRWNADKPSAALDPYIPTWLTTSSANHRPANFWKSFFFFLKHWKEIVKSGAISCWTDVDQFQIWSSHSLILEVQIITDIIYQSIMGMLTYLHSMSLRCSYMIFSVAYLYWLLRGLISLSLSLYIYIKIYSYISSSCIIFARSLPRYIQRCVVGPYRNDTGWAIMEELSIRQRVRTFLISWGQKTLV